MHTNNIHPALAKKANKSFKTAGQKTALLGRRERRAAPFNSNVSRLIVKYLYLILTLVSFQINANNDMAKQYLERIYSVDQNFNKFAEDTFKDIINKEFKENTSISKTLREIFIKNKTSYLKLVNKNMNKTHIQMLKETRLALAPDELKELINIQAIFEKKGKFTATEQELILKHKKNGLFNKDKELSLKLYKILENNYVFTYEKFITLIKPDLDNANIQFYKKKDNTFRFQYKTSANNTLKPFAMLSGALRSDAAPRPLAMR